MLESVLKFMESRRGDEATLAELQVQRTEGKRQVQQAKATADSLREAAANYLVGQGPKEEDLAELAHRRYQELQGRAVAAEAEHARLAAIQATLEQKIADLQGKASVTVKVTLADLKAHRQAVQQAEREIERLVRLVEAQEAIASGVDEAPWLETKAARRAVLADLAEGCASDAELRKADQAVADAEAAIRKDRDQAEKAKDTLAGLSPRLEAARRYLTELQVDGPKLLGLYLSSAAEALGGEYSEAATRLAQLHMTLQAYQNVLHRVPGFEQVNYIAGAPPLLPLPNLPACRGLSASGQITVRDIGTIENRQREIIEPLAAAGIEL